MMTMIFILDGSWATVVSAIMLNPFILCFCAWFFHSCMLLFRPGSLSLGLYAECTIMFIAWSV